MCMDSAPGRFLLDQLQIYSVASASAITHALFHIQQSDRSNKGYHLHIHPYFLIAFSSSASVHARGNTANTR